MRRSLTSPGPSGCSAAARIGEYVRAVVSDEQQITCSVGIGPTKFIAKVASRAAKPDGLVEVTPQGIEAFLHPLPVEAMWGVGEPTADKLHRLGLFTVGDLARTPVATLRRTFGPHAGRVLGELAWGRDPRRVVPQVPERSVGSQQTFAADSDRPGGEARTATDGRSHRQQDAQAGGGRADGADFGAFRGLLRAHPVRDDAHPHRRHGGDLRRGGRAVRPARARPGEDPPGRVRMQQLVDVHSAYRQPRLTDPERGWRRPTRPSMRQCRVSARQRCNVSS